MSSQINRRYFFYGSVLAGAVPAAGFGSSPSLKMLGYKSPNEKLNIASIGAGGKAASDISGCASENIIGMWPPIRSAIDCEPPLYATASIFTFAMRLNISPARCDMLPGPLVA